MSIVHSKFIVHWTGKDFDPERNYSSKLMPDKIRQLYIERLIDDLKDGFYMWKGKKEERETEKIYDCEDGWLQPEISRVCFTELKLSMAGDHAKKYGLLGIGVDRDFILKRYGNPVFYVMNGKSNTIVNARKVFNFFMDEIKKLEQVSAQDAKLRKLKGIKLEFDTLLAYFKKMNDKENELNLYDELEWRITHLSRLEDENLLKVIDKDNHIYRVRLTKEDIKVIVFPDRETKDVVFKYPDFLTLINNPICVTLDDCEHF